MKLFYDVWYRFGTPTWVEHSPWAEQAPSDLVKLFASGELLPGRAIDLGCGEGDNAIFLAQHGFQVTGIASRARRSTRRGPRPARPVLKSSSWSMT
jgi:SAM-dependent methyltransferase